MSHDVKITFSYQPANADRVELTGWIGEATLRALNLEINHNKCEYTMSHTRAFCGNPDCRES